MIKVYLDFDNTIVESDKKMIEILNYRYHGDKTEADMEDYDYKSMFPVPKEEIMEIFNDEEFFKGLEFKSNAYETIDKHKDKIDFVVVSVGPYENLERKKAWLSENLPQVRFVGIETTEPDKSVVDMSDGIFIDDNKYCLFSSNASSKFLFRSGHNYKWHQIEPCDDIYLIDTWNEIDEILSFIEEYNFNTLVKRGKYDE